MALEPVSATLLIRASDEGSITTRLDLPEVLSAPVEAGQEAGTLTVEVGGRIACTCPVRTAEGVEKLTLWGVLQDYLKFLLCGTA